MNRRRFIRPPLAEPARPPGGFLDLLRVSRRAMATTFEVALPAGTPSGQDAAEAALDLADAIEQQLTVYRADSEVSELNRHAADGPVPVSPTLFALLEECAALAAFTGGAFDPATGSLVAAWAHARRLGRIPTPAELAAARAAGGMRHVVLDTEALTVKFRVPGLALNLGAVGKGYALDRMAGLVRDRFGVRSALLHAGGSSVVALGTPPGEPRGWLAAVRHPADDAATVGAVWLADQALGTSAATFQYFEFEGKRYGHLLDPRTGWPAAGTASASVVAPTGAAADALSTAAFVLSQAGARELCVARPGLAAVMLGDAAGAAPVPVNVPPGRYQPPARRIQWPTFRDD